MRDCQQPWENVKDMQQMYGTKETVIDSKQPWEAVRDMKQLHCTGKDSERRSAIMRDCERHVSSPWDQRNDEREPATIGES